jgi:hypothetical protein
MSLWIKIGLFLSAYSPLFLILTIKNYPYINLIPFFLIIIGYSMIVWGLILYDSKKSTKEFYKVLNVENKTHESLSYLAPYIVAFLSFDFTKWQDITILFIFLLIIFVAFLNSDLIYINPILMFFKRKIYRVEVCKSQIECEKTKREIILISKESKIEIGSNIHANDIDKGVLWK